MNAALRPQRPTDLRIRTLSNGLRAVVVQTAVEDLVAVDVWVQAGSAMEQPSERGAAHLLEHMLFKGTKSRGPGEIDAAVESYGGVLNAGTSRDYAHFFATVEAGALKHLLGILADALQNPRFDEGETELERQVILDELARRLNVDALRREDIAFQTAYSGSASALPVLATSNDILKLRPEALRRFHERCYRPQNCVVVAVGDLLPEQALATIQDVFGSWNRNVSATAPSAPVPPEPAWKPGRFGPVKVAAIGAMPSQEILVYRTPPAKSAGDLIHAELVSAIVANACQAEVRTSGSIDCEAVHGCNGGVLYIAADEKLAARVFARAEKTLDRLSDSGPTHGELVEARRLVAGRYLYEAETVGGLARQMGYWTLLGDAELPVAVEQKMATVAPSAVRGYVRRYMRPSSSERETTAQ